MIVGRLMWGTSLLLDDTDMTAVKAMSLTVLNELKLVPKELSKAEWDKIWNFESADKAPTKSVQSIFRQLRRQKRGKVSQKLSQLLLGSELAKDVSSEKSASDSQPDSAAAM